MRVFVSLGNPELPAKSYCLLLSENCVFIFNVSISWLLSQHLLTEFCCYPLQKISVSLAENREVSWPNCLTIDRNKDVSSRGFG